MVSICPNYSEEPYILLQKYQCIRLQGAASDSPGRGGAGGKIHSCMNQVTFLKSKKFDPKTRMAPRVSDKGLWLCANDISCKFKELKFGIPQLC